MKSETAIITGGTAGLGLACARVCASRGIRVVLASRDAVHGERAAALIRRESPDAEVRFVQLDLASLASVRAFVDRIACEEAPTALICNAGLQVVTGTTFTEDGYETTFAVNHLAHFLLAKSLMPKLADGARIVFVSSDTHDPKELTPGMPKPRYVEPRELAEGGPPSFEAKGPAFAGRIRYTTSKLLNVMCAYEMSRHAPRDIAVNAFDPGFMPGTDLARDYGPLSRFLFRRVLSVLVWFVPNVNRVEVSAKRLAALATGPSFAGITGKYVSRGRVAQSSPDSYDKAAAKELWAVSEQLTRKTNAAIAEARR